MVYTSTLGKGNVFSIAHGGGAGGQGVVMTGALYQSGGGFGPRRKCVFPGTNSMA